jgi:hypothetical protein
MFNEFKHYKYILTAPFNISCLSLERFRDAGPFSTSPENRKELPWHGHTNTSPDTFNAQPRWVHAMLKTLISPPFLMIPINLFLSKYTLFSGISDKGISTASFPVSTGERNLCKKYNGITVISHKKCRFDNISALVIDKFEKLLFYCLKKLAHKRIGLK